MHDDIATSKALSDLYRSSRPHIDGLDAETLAAFVDGHLDAARHAGIAARIDASPQARAIVATLRDLAGDVQQIAASIDDRRGQRHALGHRDTRRAAAAVPTRRWVRWTGAMAACAMVAVAVVAFNGAHRSNDLPASPENDRIFSMQDDRIFHWTPQPAGAGVAEPDRVFDSSFAGG